jgi:alpha-galactosidase
LTRRSGFDELTYASFFLYGLPDAFEVRLSQYNELMHTYEPAEYKVERRHFENEMALRGPILVGTDGEHSLLMAYEHGSQADAPFVEFALRADRSVHLRAARGNYYDGQVVSDSTPYTTFWMSLAVVPGDVDALAEAFRTYILKYQAPSPASRTPYIYYNTWNFQERNKHWNGRSYLESMTETRMLQEIAIAHRMGVEVFVVDTGWYDRTGDWGVSSARFPNGLGPIRAALERCGMQLGLWLAPNVAATTSRLLREHEDCVMLRAGQKSGPFPVWETDESYEMCLVSRYAEGMARAIIRLRRELGAVYFKWDSVNQFGCDAAGHAHGGTDNDIVQRADSYAFQMPLAMADMVQRVQAECPDVIIDFDVTEAGRCVGLGFLEGGKYFLINNGPYTHEYDIPKTIDGNTNLFFFPGQARSRVCRYPLTYDKWIPSVLFLTHYLPDDPAENQLASIGSLILGHGGLWGDLPTVSEEGVQRLGHWLGLYKQVRDDMTQVSLLRTGTAGADPEIYEKIHPDTGRGAVVAFARQGRYTYVTAARVSEKQQHTGGVTVRRDIKGLARIDFSFEKPGAQFVFFGA